MPLINPFTIVFFTRAYTSVREGWSRSGPSWLMEDPLLDNPVDLILMILVAVGSFLWSVRAGGPTEELGEILAAQEERDRAQAMG